MNELCSTFVFVAESYAEWYIPVKSFDTVTVPKKMLDSLFEMISKESIDKLADLV
jgi:hypothetical protein